MKDILVPVSPGELLDKITILRIKSRRMTDEAKLRNVRRELELLEATWRDAVGDRQDLSGEEAELRRVNAVLWDTEDAIREREAARDFGPEFIELARKVYITNDERADIKKRVNARLGSTLIEEKSYRPYRRP